MPVNVEGKPVLQVSGFGQESELDGLLRRNDFAKGQAAIAQQSGENPKPMNASSPRAAIRTGRQLKKATPAITAQARW